MNKIKGPFKVTILARKQGGTVQFKRTFKTYRSMVNCVAAFPLKVLSIDCTNGEGQVYLANPATYFSDRIEDTK